MFQSTHWNYIEQESVQAAKGQEVAIAYVSPPKQQDSNEAYKSN